MGYSLSKNNPVWEQIGDYTVTGSAITSYTFSGLDLGKDDEIMLVSDYTCMGASYVNLYVNENNTDANYWRQGLYVYGTTVGADRQNNPRILNTTTGEKNSIITNIKLTNSGYVVAQTKESAVYGGSSLSLMAYFMSSTFTATSITSLTVSAVALNNIGVGSRFQLYKLKATQVADIIIDTATTSVDITGLTIDKGSEYLLVANYVSSVSATHNISVNNNNTLTNYYYQQLHAKGSSAPDGWRANAPNIFTIGGSGNLQYGIAFMKIKLTNSGYFEYQANGIKYFGSSTTLTKNYGTSTFTMSSITQLTLTASQANGIGIGSRFQLYKLKGGA